MKPMKYRPIHCGSAEAFQLQIMFRVAGKSSLCHPQKLAWPTKGILKYRRVTLVELSIFGLQDDKGLG